MRLALFAALCLATVNASATKPTPADGPPTAEEEALAAAQIAAELGEDALIPGLPPGPKPAPDSVDLTAHTIGKLLRCPVCQGLSVADSTAPAAVAMQRRIHELVAAGYADDQIIDFFISRYGDWILLDPPASGLNLLIWLTPGIAAGLGLTWAASTVVQWRREEDPVPLPSDVGAAPRDPYEQRLLAELERDGGDNGV